MKFVKPIFSRFFPSEWNLIPASSPHTAERSALRILLNAACLTGNSSVYRLFFLAVRLGTCIDMKWEACPILQSLLLETRKKCRGRKNASRERFWLCYLCPLEAHKVIPGHFLTWIFKDRLEKMMCLASQFREDIRTELLGGPRSWKSAYLLVKVPYYGFMSMPFGSLLSLSLLICI